MKYLFYLEPHSFLFRNESEAVVYNTINSAYIPCLNMDNPYMQKIIDAWEDSSNGYGIVLDDTAIYDHSTKKFIEDIRNSFSGDCIPWDPTLDKPYIFKPQLFLNIDIRARNSRNALGVFVLHNLHEVTLYLPSGCKSGCKDCTEFYKQFNHCTQVNEGYLQLEYYQNLLSLFQKNGIQKVNFIGGDLRGNRYLQTLLNENVSSSFKKTVYLNYKHINGFEWEMITKSQSETVVLIDSDDLKRIEILPDIDNVQWNFIVASDSDLGKINALPQIENRRTKILPFYNGENLDFFAENVFMELDDIIEKPIDRKNIFRHQTLNDNFFGKLFIMPSGDVYSNLLMPPIGNLSTCTIKELVYKELDEGNVWLKTRNTVTPCKNCLNKDLCPSISNYEFVIGKYNLCHVKP